MGVAVDGKGNTYVAIPSLHLVAKIAPDGMLSRFAGTGFAGFRGDGVKAELTRLSAPNDVAVDKDGNVFIADTENNRIRKVGADGLMQTVAGNGLLGYMGDGDKSAQLALNKPAGLGLDRDGNLLIADTGNNRIRQLSPAGTIRTLAGNGGIGFAGDGGMAAASMLSGPTDVAGAPDGSIYIADTSNHRIRRMVLPAPPAAPAISAGGVVNAADGSPRHAPGSLFSVFGTNFAARQRVAGGTPWPTALEDVIVKIDGRQAPLYFVSGGQINGQVPFETAPGEATVQVMAGSGSSPEVKIQVSASAPGILLFGAGRAVAQNPDGSVNTADNGALVGDPLVVYLTGQGLLDNPVGTGEGAPASPLSRPVLPVSAAIGGQDATVLFLGLSPGFVGLAQANLVVPDLPPGDYPVVLTIGGVASNAGTVTVVARP
jgi:uncharacterized protein (TIGR03437 family)